MHVEWNSLDKKSESSVNVGYVDLGDEAPVVFFFFFFFFLHIFYMTTSNQNIFCWMNERYVHK